MEVRGDSYFQWADPYVDEQQNAFVWDIINLPKYNGNPDDRLYRIRKADDRLDIIAYKYLGDVNLLWVIQEVNTIPDALDLSEFLNKDIIIPSRETVEKEFLNAS